jgi:curved DNA-binding protein CbpA
VKAAYKKKALENHPDRFPPDCKSQAEARFKLISEAYTRLRSVSFPLQHVCFSVFASHLLLAIAG